MSEAGIVLSSGGGSYRIGLDSSDEVVEASLRGRIKNEAASQDRVVIGDRVQVRRTDGSWTIEEVEPRSTALIRRGRGGRIPRVLAANLDRVFAVVSLGEPAATPELIDRLLVLIEASGMRPILLLNKIDLAGAGPAAARLDALYRPLGYEVLTASARGGEGLEMLRSACRRGTSALVGPSGVGKSSLLNALEPALDLPTGALSRKTGTGRHTTVGSRLMPLMSGGLIADTPGFSDVGLWGVGPDEIAGCFPEIEGLGDACRFRGCAHVKEPDCAVRGAVERGAVAESRYGSYVTLRQEAIEAAADST